MKFLYDYTSNRATLYNTIRQLHSSHMTCSQRTCLLHALYLAMYVCDYFDFQMAVSLVNVLVGFGLMNKPTLLHSGANICSFIQFIFLWCIRKLLFDNINNRTIWCIFRVTPCIKKQFLSLCNTMSSLAFGFWSLEHLIHLLQAWVSHSQQGR